jgi:micrococcal nuclease
MDDLVVTDKVLNFYRISLVRVIDGDTIVADVNVGLDIWLSNQRIRLLGVNTPEPRGDTKEQGLIVSRFVKSLLQDKPLIIKCFKRDNFGRLLADVFYLPLEDTVYQSLSELLLNLNMAVVYELHCM